VSKLDSHRDQSKRSKSTYLENGSQPPSEDAVHCGQHSLQIYRLDTLPEQVNGETERGSAFGAVNVQDLPRPGVAEHVRHRGFTRDQAPEAC